MRAILAGLAVLGLAALVMNGAVAQDKKEGKEVTLKGTITCAKCDLGETKACATVIVVEKDKKKTVYYFDKAGDKKHHSAICTAAKKGEVTGVVSQEGKKSIITVKSVKFE